MRQIVFIIPAIFIIISVTVLSMEQEHTAAQKSSSHMSEGYIESTDGIELYYRVMGDGPDTLIALHGGPGLHMNYIVPDLEPLTEQFTVIYYDSFNLITFSRMRGDICNAPEQALRNTWTVNTLTLKSIGNYDWRDDYHNIELPVLIITGVRDVFPVENFQEWEAAFANAQLVLLDGAGHYPHIEHPEEFFRWVQEFLEKNSAINR